MAAETEEATVVAREAAELVAAALLVEVATVVATVVDMVVARVAADGAVAAMAVATVATVAQMAVVARAAEAWAVVVKVVTAAVFWVEARQPRTSAAAAIVARPTDPNGPMTARGRLTFGRLAPRAALRQPSYRAPVNVW
jgi:hypothetical protein